MTTECYRELVDDNEVVIRDSLAGILRGEGFEVESTFSSIEALRLLTSRDDFEFLFADLTTNEMDGAEILRHAA